VTVGNFRTDALASIFEGPTKLAYAHTQTTASTGSLATLDLPAWLQNIEGVYALAGRSVTLSGKLWTNSGSLTIPATLGALNFGTGGSPSPAVRFDKAINWSIGTTPKKFSVRLDIPSITGASFGTNGGTDSTALGLWLPAGWTGTLNIAEPQLEISSRFSSSDLTGKGGAPTTFEYRGIGPELARVMRFFRILQGGWHGAQYQANLPIGAWLYYERMRVSPSVAMGAAIESQNVGTPTVGPVYSDSFRLFSNTTNQGGSYCTYPFTMDARF
jgi:hypothetical protein